ncbi:hypothetical protein P9112_010716 [Eukaryota sp. TZLM1-RC]
MQKRLVHPVSKNKVRLGLFELTLDEIIRNIDDPYPMTLSLSIPQQDSYVTDKRKRYVTFSKRRKTLVSQAHQMALEDNNEVLLVTITEAGNIAIYASSRLKEVANSQSFLDLMQQSLQLSSADASIIRLEDPTSPKDP